MEDSRTPAYLAPTYMCFTGCDSRSIQAIRLLWGLEQAISKVDDLIMQQQAQVVAAISTGG